MCIYIYAGNFHSDNDDEPMDSSFFFPQIFGQSHIKCQANMAAKTQKLSPVAQKKWKVSPV